MTLSQTPSKEDDFITSDEDLGYRRGFDQGVAALAYALGLDNARLQALAWKKRVTAFRHGRIAESPFYPSPAEIQELHAAFHGSVSISAAQRMALISAVDLLTGSCSGEYIEENLGDYRHGESRHIIARSLYRLVDELARLHPEQLDD